MRQYLDTSVILKWFLKDEDGIDEADSILREITSLSNEFVTSEWTIPELVRGLVKGKWSKDEIDEAFGMFKELMEFQGIRTVPVSEVVMDLKDPMVKYSLYGSDAVHLASALMTGCEVFWTEDGHFHRGKLKKDMMDRGLKVLSLKDR
ncbi:MAG: type II toxin-antitoxin system VapC family toxin [Candidatus Thermoplasmatota archaeon]|jgi:predicted nucleic acid-binding protein|nr:type II toxin-antitoxin system VapC family toxin [Candidatus Thermoplasmatota archaeon]